MTLFRSTLAVLLLSLFCINVRAAESTAPVTFKRLILADTAQRVMAIPLAAANGHTVYADNLPLFATPEFEKVIQPFVGRQIDLKLVQDLGNTIGVYTRQHDRLIVHVEVPNQTSTDGTLRLTVTLGHYNQLAFQGNKWFSRKLLEDKLGIRAGDEVRLSKLEDAVNWVNSNPFRQVKVLLKDVPNEPGKADLVVGVVDVAPYRFAASYDDSGPTILGRNRYTASVQLGNLWGRDHQLSYQFSTGDNLNDFQSHSIDYTMPLPWHHYLEFTGAYATMKPTFEQYGIDLKGESGIADLKYKIPLGSGDRVGELFAGIDFQESNNNLEYGGTAISAAKTHIYKGMFGFTGVQKDSRGAWSVGATLNLSPGGIDSQNSDAAFQPGVTNGVNHTGRFGAKAQYATLDLSLQRQLKLSHDWQLFTRLYGQLATSNVIGAEQLSIGGVNTVRGFDTNIMSGEQGFVLNNDLLTPAWSHPVPFLRKGSQPLETRLSLFYDAGQVFYKKHFPLVDQTGRQVGWDDDFLHPIASVGIGLRANIGNNFSLNFDYGWQVTHAQYPADQHGRGHIKVVLAF